MSCVTGVQTCALPIFILRDPEDFAGMNEEWRAWFPEDPPARQGAKLPIDAAGLLVSIAVIATA
jgi:2-iminobutanoate/2-iminopropanoate deaminase